MPADTKPAREVGYYWVRHNADSPLWYVAQLAAGDFWWLCGHGEPIQPAEIDERRITREPAAPAEVAEAVTREKLSAITDSKALRIWAMRREEFERRHGQVAASRMDFDTANGHWEEAERFKALAAAASRAPTDAQRREIAEARKAGFEAGLEAAAKKVTDIGDYGSGPLARMILELGWDEAAPHAAGIIGGEHD